MRAGTQKLNSGRRIVRPGSEGMGWEWVMENEGRISPAPASFAPHPSWCQPAAENDLLLYTYVPGQRSLADGLLSLVPGIEAAAPFLNLCTAALVTLPQMPGWSTVNPDSLDKAERMLEELDQDADDPSLVSDLSRLLGTVRPGPDTQGATIGVGRIVPEKGGKLCVLLPPGTPSSQHHSLARIIEELMFFERAFATKPAAPVELCARVRAGLLDLATEDWQHEALYINTLVELLAHMHRRLHTVAAPPEARGAFLDLVRQMAFSPENFCDQWRTYATGS